MFIFEQMKYLSVPFLILYLLPALPAAAQSYAAKISSHREQYKKDFLTDPRSPLKADDTGYLRFYAPDKRYVVQARVTLTPQSQPFPIGTHSGKTKMYRQYATVRFVLFRHDLQLSLYQSQDLMKDPKYKDALFLPFTDLTNNQTSYGGGRYLDVSITDIKNGSLTIDFNKAYNPYCAFAGGYSCPIPPDENRLPIKIAAGEQQFGKPVSE